jgi:hypothetical protein
MRNNIADKLALMPCNNFNTAIVDGEFPASGSFIEVGEYQHVAFLIRAGTLDSALTCQVQQAAAINGATKDVTGAVVVVGAGDDNELVSVEVEVAKLDLANNYHYLTLDVSGAAGGNDYLDILFVGMNPRKTPVTQNVAYSQAVILGG